MSATVRSGLIFGLVGLIVVIIVGFVPFVGALLCGPVAALAVGALAGYFARRWSLVPVGVGQGVLAGAIAGVGTLIGSIIFWIAAVTIAQNTPGYQDQLGEVLSQIQQQQPNANLTQDELRTLIGATGPIAGLCFGILSLIIALVGGAIGALIGNRGQETPPAVPPAVPPVPPAV